MLNHQEVQATYTLVLHLLPSMWNRYLSLFQQNVISYLMQNFAVFSFFSHCYRKNIAHLNKRMHFEVTYLCAYDRFPGNV